MYDSKKLKNTRERELFEVGQKERQSIAAYTKGLASVEKGSEARAANLRQ